MNPDATKRNYKTLDKAVDLVNTAVLHRRVKNKERDHALTVRFIIVIPLTTARYVILNAKLARTKSASLNPALLLEQAIQEQRDIVAEAEYEVGIAIMVL